VTRAPDWVDSHLWLPPVQDAVCVLPSRASELLAVSRLRFKFAVWLLTGHTTQRAHVESHIYGAAGLLCGNIKDDALHIVILPGSALQKIQILGSHIYTTMQYTGHVSLHLV
jgi:hypothetical protein